MDAPTVQPKEQPLKLGGVRIRKDAEGRYCLNDIHRDSGGAPKDQPAKFFATDTAKVLVEELERSPKTEIGSPVKTIRGGSGTQGTYVVRELVYAYAMWIRPSFYLRVIRAYDQLATQGISVHENHAERFRDDPMKYLNRFLT